MNLPNKLTVARICMIPAVIAVILLTGVCIPTVAGCLIAAAIFGITSFTDFLDGKIARKYNLVTSFGKFLDPLADKMLVIGTMLAIFYRFDALRFWYLWALIIVIFREFAVTGLRMIAVSDGGEVIAANMLGKIKTVTQIVALLMALLEPAIEYLLGLAFDYPLAGVYPLTILTIVISTFLTLWSGISYIWSYRGYLKQK